MKFLRITLFSLLLLTLAGISFFMGVGVGQGVYLTPASAQINSNGGGIRSLIAEPKQFKVLGEIWDILATDFVDPNVLKERELGKGAIEGLIQALDDPHTSYIDAESYSRERLGFRSSYEGIGAHVTVVEGEIVIVAPIPGSPAEAAGIRPGDKIISVNGESTSNLSLADTVQRIKGPRGSAVSLSIIHPGDKEPVTLQISRDEIKTPSVIVENLPDNLARVRILYFAQRTDDELEEALKKLRAQDVKGVIIDLRNNPGGLLDTTVNATSQFLKRGVIAYQVARNGRKEALEVRPGGVASDIPLTVLINENSASGSEIMAGAIQDANRGPLIGAKSFGKGSVNHLRELSDGSALYVTVARWLTPNGRVIEGKGLTPDMEVPLSQEQAARGIDTQLERAVQYLREGR